MKLTAVMLGSENAKALGDFYAKLFGTPEWNDGDWYGFDIGGSSLIIGPHSEVHGKNDAPGRIMFVLETEDVKADFDKLKTAGAVVVAEPYKPAMDDKEGWLATLADLDGNFFQLATPWGEASK
ncbi:MAG TPA: VOC family protein [Candidatus Saccharimonadales bacterium]|nr:VOC family protein [Candidatus Saccharimonadales bacterium]